MKYLVIVESPVKIGKLEAILPKNYIIKASCGHIMDLDPNDMALDFTANFKPNYKFYPTSASNNKLLKETFKKCDRLIVAADLDREGEFIGESLVKLLGVKDYDRIIFNAITKRDIEHAIANPIKLNDNLIHAQKTRRFLDRIFGYKLSPLLKRIPNIGNTKKLGCGRVQSTIVKLVIEQDEKVNLAIASNSGLTFEGHGEFVINETIKIDTYMANVKNKRLKIPSTRCAIILISDMIGLASTYTWKMKHNSKKTIVKSPGAPYTTATLQCDVANKLKWPVKKIMQVAQKLYEKGFITYMRSDSTLLSEDALQSCEQYIKSKFGDEFSNRHQYETKADNAQEAHEAIRPTNINNDTSSLDEAQMNLYIQIRKRTLASQMSKAVIETCQYVFVPFSFGLERQFRMVGNKSAYVFKGYTAIYNKDDKTDVEEGLMDIQDSPLESLDLNFVNITMNKMSMKECLKPIPTRFTESQLIKTVTLNGIGRPGTTAGFITKIQEKDYVRKECSDGDPIKTVKISYDRFRDVQTMTETVTINIGSESNRLVPTPLGKMVNEFLEENFPLLMNIQFTANLESKLTDIVSGKLDWLTVLHEFYDLLTPQIDTVMKKYNVIAEKPITNKNDVIICKYKGEDVKYVKIPSGTFILYESNGKKLWIKSSVKPKENDAIKMIESKLNKPSPKILKKFGNYTIMESETGQFMRIDKGKKTKFHQLRNNEGLTITEEECLIISKRLFKVNKNKNKSFPKKKY